MYNLLKCHEADNDTNKIKNKLEDIAKSCDTCRKYYGISFRFRASMPPDQIIFNHELAMDLLLLRNAPVLHDLDTHTMLQNAEFIRGKSANKLWESFLPCWMTVFIAYPNTIRLDQESSFNSEESSQLTRDAGLKVQFSGVEAHSSIGVGEKYHGPPRRMYNKVLD